MSKILYTIPGDPRHDPLQKGIHAASSTADLQAVVAKVFGPTMTPTQAHAQPGAGGGGGAGGAGAGAGAGAAPGAGGGGGVCRAFVAAESCECTACSFAQSTDPQAFEQSQR